MVLRKKKLNIYAVQNFNKIINQAGTTRSELEHLIDKLNLQPVNICWQKDYKDNYANNGCIINIGNPIFLGGTHWVVVYKDNYFDPFGLPPILALKDKKYNNKQIQGLNDGKCGLYCVLWLYYAKKNKINKFYEKFS